MYTHMPTQASRLASASPSFISTSQYHYAAQGGTSFPYAHSTYPTLPIPGPSSSSLAAALDPHPDYNPKNTLGTSSQLVSPVSSREQLGEQVTGAHAEAASINDLTSQVDMSNRYARRYSNATNGSFRPQHQMFQEPNTQRHALDQGQSPTQNVYSPTQSPSSSSSTSYIPPQQNAVYATFSAYPGDLPLPSIAPPVGPDTSQLPIFTHEYYDPASISGDGLDEFNASGGWNYAQSSSSFQASQGLYMSLDNADANIAAGHDTSAWLDTSFESHSQPQIAPGEMFGNLADPNYSASSTSGSVVSGYFGADQSRQRLPQEQDNFSAVQDPHQPNSQTCSESQEYFINSTSQQSSSSQHSTPPSVGFVSAVTQGNSNACENEAPRRPWGHNALMPPPPVPARTPHNFGMDRPHSDSRPSQSRRHTVAVPPRDEARRNERTSIEPPLASASTRPSSTAPGSASSSSLHEDTSVVDGLAASPRLATLSLNDSQWVLANECNRQALVESYRTLHGPHNVPVKLLKETSALERSKRLDRVLLDFKGPKDAKTSNNRSPEAETSSEGNDGRSAHITSAQSEKVADGGFLHVTGPGWVPALPGYEIEGAFASQDHGNAESPTSPTTTEELVAPGGEAVPSANREDIRPYAYATPANPDAPVLSPASFRPVIALMRHDGHLASHVSGLGGGFHNAYDGRSYLTDDSEDDPEHVPPAPPGARSGDHPALARFLPNPLLKRGEKWHDLINPRPSTSSTKGLLPKQKETGKAVGNDSAEKDTNEEEEEALKTLEKEGVKKEEQGEGWGYVEAGSHGPQFALHGTDKTAQGNRRLKLSTEKKTPPKMACHFCRNRKIACGASKCGDPTICNQCERRNIRCIFPTISRRGMRTRNQRSAHTVDGTDEADKDSVEHEGSPGRTDIQMVPHSPMEGSSGPNIRKTSKAKRQVEKGIKDKETTKGKGKGRGRKKAGASDDSQESSSRLTNEDVEMEGDNQANGSSTQVDRVTTAVYADDPLASLAADMQWSNRDQQSLPSPSLQFNSRPPTAFSPPSSISSSSLSTALHFPPHSFDISYTGPNSTDIYSFDVEPSAGPFTSDVMQRRN